jgi:hypothetical protein
MADLSLDIYNDVKAKRYAPAIRKARGLDVGKDWSSNRHLLAAHRELLGVEYNLTVGVLLTTLENLGVDSTKEAVTLNRNNMGRFRRKRSRPSRAPRSLYDRASSANRASTCSIATASASEDESLAKLLPCVSMNI